MTQKSKEVGMSQPFHALHGRDGELCRILIAICVIVPFVAPRLTVRVFDTSEIFEKRWRAHGTFNCAIPKRNAKLIKSPKNKANKKKTHHKSSSLFDSFAYFVFTTNRNF